ncbi:MAG: SDR family NAD(P)-dependent oxidoreductase [Candidatus Puniceispirillaceae bacterium]
MKRILITGATDGLGARAAHMLAEQGHHLILHGRDQAKLDHIRSALPDKGALSVICCDLSSLSQTASMADEISRSSPEIDVLINNAGVLAAPAHKTKEGLELRFVVNCLAPYLLTLKLLPCLPSQGRVVNLSSAAQRPLVATELGQFAEYTDMEAYAKSKLAITSWTRQLAKAHDDKVFVSVNPASLLGTKMVKEGFGIDGHDITTGADIICRAAISDEFSSANGLYYDNDAKSFGPPHEAALDDALGQDIITEMRRILADYIA